jgi:hypothetical protein
MIVGTENPQQQQQQAGEDEADEDEQQQQQAGEDEADEDDNSLTADLNGEPRKRDSA